MIITTCDAVLNGTIEVVLGVLLLAVLLTVAFIFLLGVVKLVDEIKSDRRNA